MGRVAGIIGLTYERKNFELDVSVLENVETRLDREAPKSLGEKHPRFVEGFEIGPEGEDAVSPGGSAGTITKTSESLPINMPLWLQIIAAIAVSLGALVGGFSSAYTAPAIESMASNETLFVVTENDVSWIGSLQPLFALVGGLMGGPMLEYMGRKWTIILGRIPFIPAFLLICYAQDVWMIMAGRILAGIGVGIETLSSPVYLGETTDHKIRGTLGLLPTITGNFGVLLAFIVGTYIDWRDLAMVGALLPIPFFFFVFHLPESPVWEHTKAQKKALKEIAGSLTTDTTKTSKTSSFINKWIPTSWREMCERDSMWAIFVCLGLQFFQQFSGINAVIYYTVKIFEESGSTIDSYLSSVIIGVVNMISTLLATGLVDKVGRRILMLVSNGLMGVSLIVISVFLYIQDSSIVCYYCGWVPLIALVVFIFGFSIGAGPLPWLMMGELLPKRIRGPGASLVTAFHWGCTFVVTKTFIDISSSYGNHVAFFLFGFICLVGIAFLVWVPETNGKTLEEIENQMSSGSKCNVLSSRATLSSENP